MKKNFLFDKLNNIEKLIKDQSLLQKDVLNLNEACEYLQMSHSHIYKLTSNNSIPHFKPNSKKIYFNRKELDMWLQRNKAITTDEIEQQAADYIIKNRRTR